MASSTVGSGPLCPAPARTLLSPARSQSRPQISSPSSQPRPRPSLELLPNELLVPIAAALVPLAPLTTRFSLRPPGTSPKGGTWEFRDASHQWADWLACHTSLLAFAQTSRRMAAIVRPLLYHTLVIPDAKSLVSLMLRMQSHPEIRPWIRELTCLANLTGVRTVYDLHREWNRQSGGKWASSHQVGSDATIGLALLENIVLAAPNLKDLLIAFPDHQLPDSQSIGHALDQDLLHPGIRETLQRWALESSPSPDEEPFAFYLNFLQSTRVASLRIYCHREGILRDLTFSRILSDCAVTNLASFTSLKTLELCCSSFGNYSNDDMLLPPLPHIEHIRLYGSYLHEPRLVAICLACTNLQTLLVHFERSTTDEDRDFLPEGKTLNEALLGLAPTLRSLELITLPEGHYLTRGRERPRKPENHRLTCIPDLTKLENLALDWRGVFGTFGVLEYEDGERLFNTLPPALRDFTLVCEFGTAKDWKQGYLGNLDVVLQAAVQFCDTLSPRLSSLTLAMHTWPAESRFRNRFARQVAEVSKKCRSVGVKFHTIDIHPCYQDEDEAETEDEEWEDDGVEVTPEDVAAAADALEEQLELEEEDEASEYYLSDDESDPERAARAPQSFAEFMERLGEDHGHTFDELFYAYHEDRWDEYLF
ncbi:hypothetical protein QBC34DRAFT_427507 [Podospora aff. communis PSN243]|uniref:F-box domain-containing protein n=1 Tax=Podospora aff. communis PSN243 TaxID=3040156 RepID=A0AAV9GJM4_9PEZI|nr:hypothetical protein QBC34DRAFT_427507 [Podospora aff. communis PSN243]